MYLVLFDKLVINATDGKTVAYSRPFAVGNNQAIEVTVAVIAISGSNRDLMAGIDCTNDGENWTSTVTVPVTTDIGATLAPGTLVAGNTYRIRIEFTVTGSGTCIVAANLSTTPKWNT